MHDDASRHPICLIACDDDIDAVGQGSADGFKCLSAHNDRLAARKVAEVLEVCGHAPWQGVVFADDTVSVHRRDKRDDHSRGATDTLRNSATFSLNSSTEPLFSSVTSAMVSSMCRIVTSGASCSSRIKCSHVIPFSSVVSACSRLRANRISGDAAI